MSITLKLIDDAATELDLNGSGVTLLDGYYPEVSIDLSQKISDSFEVVISATSASLINEKIRTINRAFQYAEANTVGPMGMWLNFSIDGGTAWRSRVYRGMITYNSKLDFYYRRQKVRATIFIERDPFWEGAETALNITNANGLKADGLKVLNCNDGSCPVLDFYVNEFKTIADTIEGDIPAPCRLEMTNLYNDSNRLYDVIISRNTRSSPGYFDHWLEGEDASYGGTRNANSSASGGYHQTFTESGDAQVQVARWTLDSTFLEYANKQYFKILAGFKSSTTSGIRVQMKIMFPSPTPLTVVASSQEVLLTTSNLQEIGELQIPPWVINSSDLNPLELCLYAQKTGGFSFNLDYIQISPVDSFRKLHPIGYGVPYTYRLVDDGVNDQLYVDDGTENKAGHYTAIGNRIMLKPNCINEFYILQTGDTGDIDVARALSVILYYRPRRISL